MFTVGDPLYKKERVDYINNKDKFTIYIKPLTGNNATDDYEIINEKELIVNSAISPNAEELFGKLGVGLSDMYNNYPLAKTKHLNDAINLRAQINTTVSVIDFYITKENKL